MNKCVNFIMLIYLQIYGNDIIKTIDKIYINPKIEQLIHVKSQNDMIDLFPDFYASLLLMNLINIPKETIDVLFCKIIGCLLSNFALKHNIVINNFNFLEVINQMKSADFAIYEMITLIINCIISSELIKINNFLFYEFFKFDDYFPEFLWIKFIIKYLPITKRNYFLFLCIRDIEIGIKNQKDYFDQFFKNQRKYFDLVISFVDPLNKDVILKINQEFLLIKLLVCHNVLKFLLKQNNENLKVSKNILKQELFYIKVYLNAKNLDMKEIEKINKNIDELLLFLKTLYENHSFKRTKSKFLCDILPLNFFFYQFFSFKIDFSKIFLFIETNIKNILFDKLKDALNELEIENLPIIFSNSSFLNLLQNEDFLNSSTCDLIYSKNKWRNFLNYKDQKSLELELNIAKSDVHKKSIVMKYFMFCFLKKIHKITKKSNQNLTENYLKILLNKYFFTKNDQ